MKKILSIIALFILINEVCFAEEVAPKTNSNLSSTLSNLEKSMYDKVYTQDSITARVNRLENTMTGSSENGSLEERITHLDKTIKNNSVKSDKNNKLFLEMMENRYLGVVHLKDSFEERISRLEKAVFGKKFEGSEKERFNHLIENVPLNITGVSVTGSNGKTQAVKPEITRFKEISSSLNLTYNSQYGDYLANISRYDSDKILRWQCFPVNIYISPSIDANRETLIKKSAYTWDKYIPITFTSSLEDANIVIKADDSAIATEPALSFFKNKTGYKVIIHAGCLNSDNPQIIERFYLHELGHALGIWGHSDNQHDLMYNYEEIKNDIRMSSRINKQNSLFLEPLSPSIEDLNTLYKIYEIPSSINNYQNGK